MKMFDFVPQLAKMLKNLDGWMTKAEAHAKQKGYEVDTLCHARLAPDQYAFVRQVQSTCDAAKFSVAYLAAKEPPAHPDTETTFAQLHARIHSCMSFLETVSEKDLEGAEARRIAPKWAQGKWMPGDRSLVEMALPNFYFHVSMAYAILRHNGVDLGKTDFMGALPFRD